MNQERLLDLSIKSDAERALPRHPARGRKSIIDALFLSYNPHLTSQQIWILLSALFQHSTELGSQLKDRRRESDSSERSFPPRVLSIFIPVFHYSILILLLAHHHLSSLKDAIHYTSRSSVGSVSNKRQQTQQSRFGSIGWSMEW